MRALLPFVLLFSFFLATLNADEGMWLFNQFPKQKVEKKYGFQVTDQFLEHLRLSSARLGSGGSGSFVSPHGLLFTNHHVAADCIQKVGSAQHDYMTRGFYAADPSDEIKCPDLEVNVLLRIDDVTDRMKKAVTQDDASAANRQRLAEIANVEKECTDKTGNKCEVVTLYSGSQSHLYQYRKYTDLRLVFAPEYEIAFFGGDPDNFTYPRYDLDCAFFRAYQNGRPADTPHYLRWSREGAKENDLAFVPGHPGFTSRLYTVAQLEYDRDLALPIALRRLESLIQALKAYETQGEENRRVAHDKLFGAENSYKAFVGEYQGLQDAALMNRKRGEEQKLRAAVDRDPKLHKEYGQIWDRVASAYTQWRPNAIRYSVVERGPVSELFRMARMTLRLPEEKAKPNEKRLREYRESALPTLELRLYSAAPITDSLEIAMLKLHFDTMQKELGPEDPVVRQVLAGKTSQQAAEEYVTTSKLKDVAERKRLASSLDAVRKSDDGMIRLARILDQPARELRKKYEDTIEAVQTSSQAKIAQARFAVYGSGDYPDATFTLRLSYGPIKGYRDKSGNPIAWATNYDGMYKHATGQDPYKLPDRWLEKKPALDLSTPLNFVSTADIIGGNSGSPTVNTKGEIVGIIFDGNIESLPWDFLYSDAQGRAVQVASQAIMEALRKVYGAEALAAELGAPSAGRQHVSGSH